MTVEFGWFIPTWGDTAAFGVPEAEAAPSMELFSGVAQSAEKAGFEYILVPVQTNCWDAYITCAMIAAKTEKIIPLVAARPGFIAPTVMAKMLSTFDQLTEGRVRVNLIAGGTSSECEADGSFHSHDERYELFDEALDVMKRAWTEEEPFDFAGKYFKANQILVKPKPYQKPFPPIYLGGLSEAAKNLCAKHADVHLFWGDTPDTIAERVAEMNARAATVGRTLRYGMRLHIIVRETEDEAWAAARALIAHATPKLQQERAALGDQSVANDRMKELAKVENHMIDQHLWSGIATVREGAGVAIVGNPEQVAGTIRRFMDAGCSSFCLSGYPHAEEAERFGRLVMPLFADDLAKQNANVEHATSLIQELEPVQG
ncbi:LLM class flavin-dependent oxidoreductase [Crystallibacter degradans]|uniref:LLM class flavin-dependent oxidoreductase n=1 Tax=Crystallibacter degradans TaxID=2726743 RepID=UPI001472859E|nr:LLM class flavin-dependent oxidoreductase [Arthrobacter sp. SF27]NMR32089.1 LLM class flavin-dependent oxidoreductase [Arthrobacter sp. SF27]